MRPKLLVFAISAGLTSMAVASDPDAWRADPNYDPNHGELAAPRTDNHPIDQTVFLAQYGIASAQQTLSEWENDPAWEERLHQRKAYREYARDRARGRLEQRLASKKEESEEPPVSQADTEPTRVAEQRSEPTMTEQEPAPGNADAASESAEAEIDLSAKLAELRGKVQSLTAERDQLAERLAALEVEHAQLQAEHEDLQIAHNELQTDHEKLQIAHAELEEDHERVVAENEQWAQRYAALEQEFTELQQQHQTLLASVETRPDNLLAVEVDVPAPDPEPQPDPNVPDPEGSEKNQAALTRQSAPVSDKAINLNDQGLAALEADNPTAAVRWFLRAARAGSVNAMNNLGYLYENGWGTVRSDQEAYFWYEKAAEKGHAHAMRNLARFYEHGHGVRANAERARNWREQAKEAEVELARANGETEGQG